eukprot:COSAG06_NODE_30122_length_544_cov_1.058427_1_plen_166_part_10
MAVLHTIMLAALSGQAACESAACWDDACVAGGCVCSVAWYTWPWGGADCGELALPPGVQLLPTPKEPGYALSEGGSSWSGIAAQDPTNQSAWTLVASEFNGCCGLNNWSLNSFATARAGAGARTRAPVQRDHSFTLLVPVKRRAVASEAGPALKSDDTDYCSDARK